MLWRGTSEELPWYPVLSIVSVSQDLLKELLGICGVAVCLRRGSRKGSEGYRISVQGQPSDVMVSHHLRLLVRGN